MWMPSLTSSSSPCLQRVFRESSERCVILIKNNFTPEWLFLLILFNILLFLFLVKSWCKRSSSLVSCHCCFHDMGCHAHKISLERLKEKANMSNNNGSELTKNDEEEEEKCKKKAIHDWFFLIFFVLFFLDSSFHSWVFSCKGCLLSICLFSHNL